MKILVCCQYYYPENVVISPMAEELVRRGHEVRVVTGLPNYGFNGIKEGYEKVRKETINGVEVIRLPLKPRKKGVFSLIKNYLSFWRNSRKYFKKLDEDYDLIYGMEMSPIIALEGVGEFAKRKKIPYILDCVDLWPESPVAVGMVKKNSLVYKKLFKWSKKVYSYADKILISSPSFEDYFHNELGIKDIPISFLAQAPLVGDNDLEPIEYEHEYTLVYGGNIGRLQEIEKFVEASVSLKGKYDFSLEIIGDGANKKSVNETIKRLGAEDVVHLHERMDIKEVERYYKGASALIVSLKDEGSPVSKTIPNKLISYMAYGKPILGNIGGDGRKVLEASSGAVLAKGEIEDIAKAMETIFAMDSKSLDAMGKNNKKYFEEHFAFERIMDDLEKEFNQVIDSKKASKRAPTDSIE